MNKYIQRVLGDSAVHVQNLIEQDENAKCVILGDVYLLCDQLEAKDKRIEALEKAGEDLFHRRITGDDMWAITCGLQLSDTHPSNNNNTKGDT